MEPIKSNEVEKVIRDGKVAVLYSKGYGAGWYSWIGDVRVVFHPELVRLVEENRTEQITDAFLKKLLGIENAYTGGRDGLTIEWLPIGTAFDIEEYDGAEGIITYDNITLIA